MSTNLPEQVLLTDIRGLIDKAKNRLAQSVNQEMTLLYWSIGKRIQEETLRFERAEYGERVIERLESSLSSEYGRGFSKRNITYMVEFYSAFPELEILQTVSAKLTWSHFLALIQVKEKKAREFYAYFSLNDGWSVRQLRSNIHRMLFESTEISKKSENEIQKGITILKNDQPLTPDLVLKDPYVLEFLNLPKDHYESDLEEAILLEIEKFILELGSGFSFIERQKRMTIDDDHYYLDLLFYNRKLKRLVALELKAGKFKPEYMGKMKFYLGWLKKHEVLEGENPPIGIILCTEKSPQQIELLDMDQSGIHVAEYWTELPPKDVFERKIREIVQTSKAQYIIHEDKLKED